jgi:hypothetical protein
MIKRNVTVIIPVSLFNDKRKTVQCNLYKDGSYDLMNLLYVHYNGVKLYVTKVKDNMYQVC